MSLSKLVVRSHFNNDPTDVDDWIRSGCHIADFFGTQHLSGPMVSLKDNKNISEHCCWKEKIETVYGSLEIPEWWTIDVLPDGTAVTWCIEE